MVNKSQFISARCSSVASAVISIYNMRRNAFISGYRKDLGQTVIYEIKHEKKILRGVKLITRTPPISLVYFSSYLM